MVLDNIKTKIKINKITPILIKYNPFSKYQIPIIDANNTPSNHKIFL